MKAIFSVASVFLGFMLLCGSAAGHGFGLSLVGNTIQAASEVPTISPHLFTEQFDAFSATEVFSDHGGVEADTGFNLPSDTLGVQFLGRLWYSDGGTAIHAPTGFTLNATSYDTSVTPNQVLGSVNITGSTTDPGSFSVVGNDDHSIGWVLSGQSAIPAGVYAFSYRATGLQNNNPLTPFEPSDPLVVAFSTPGFAGSAGGSLADAQQAVFNAIMQGDFDLDGKLTVADLQAMLSAMCGLDGYQSANDLVPADVLAIGDIDRSMVVTNADIQVLLNLLANSSTASSVQPVPEPTAVALALSALLFLALHQRSRRPPVCAR